MSPKAASTMWAIGRDRVAADERDEHAAEMTSATTTAPSVSGDGSQRGTSSRALHAHDQRPSGRRRAAPAGQRRRRSRRGLAAAGHQQADARRTSRRRRARRAPSMRPSYITSHPVGQRQHLVQLLARSSRIAAPAARRSSSSRWTRLDGAHVQAARGLHGDHELRRRVRSRGPGSGAAGCRPTAAAPGVSTLGAEIAYSSFSVSALRRAAAPSSRTSRARSARGGSCFMIRLSVSDRLGALPDAVPGPRARGPRPAGWPHARPVGHDVPAIDARSRPVHARSPVMTSASSDWPLPATPAMPTISPARTSSDTSRSAGRPLSLTAPTSSSRQHHRARARRLPLECLEHLPADHQPGQLGRVWPARSDAGRGHPALAQHGDAVGDRQHLVELVADEDDRLAPRPPWPAGSGTAPRPPAGPARRSARP